MNGILRYIAIGTNQIAVMNMLAIGHIEHHTVPRQLVESRIYLKPDNRQLLILTEYTTAVKRSGKSPDGTKLTPQQLSAVAYNELAYGRLVNISNCDNEIHNRTGPTKHLRIPGPEMLNNFDKEFITDFKDAPAHPNDPAFYSKLYYGLVSDMRRILSGVTIDFRVYESPTRVVYQRFKRWPLSRVDIGRSPLIGQRSG